MEMVETMLARQRRIKPDSRTIAARNRGYIFPHQKILVDREQNRVP